MRRRAFIAALGGAAAWPLAARAQQPERMRRIGVLMHTNADEPEAQARLAAFLQGLQEAGWSDRPQRSGRNPLEHRGFCAPVKGCGGVDRCSTERCLTDSELRILLDLARPLSPRDREKFMQLLDQQLKNHVGELGPGSLSRIGRDCQRTVRWGQVDEAPLLKIDS